MTSPTPNLGLTYPAHGGNVGSWDTPLNTDFDTIDLVIAGTVVVAAAGSGATLTQTQANNKRISVTGVLSQNYLMTFPAIGGEWVVSNDTTGNFTVTANVTGSAVTAITITQSASLIVSSNGTNLYQAQSSSNTWTGATYAGSDVSPTSFSTTQNDYNPTNLSTATCLRLNVTAACSLTGIAGGAAGRDLELINIGTATLKCPANSTSTAANQFANTFNLAPGQSIFLRYDATSSRWRPKNIATAYSSCAIAAVSGDLLIVNGGSPNTQLTITASEAVLVDSSGNAIKFENISVTANSATTGAGGCDVGTRAASTAYFVYLVSDGVTINSMISTSATSPSLANAANYIYYKCIGWQITDSSSNFMRIRQKGQRGQYVVTAGTNTAIAPNIANGVAGTFSSTSPSLSAISVASVVPSTAIEITVLVAANYKGGSASNVLVAPSTAWGGANNGPQGSAGNVWPALPVSQTSITTTIVLEAATIAWASSDVGGAVSCLSWTVNI